MKWKMESCTSSKNSTSILFYFSLFVHCIVNALTMWLNKDTIYWCKLSIDESCLLMKVVNGNCLLMKVVNENCLLIKDVHWWKLCTGVYCGFQVVFFASMAFSCCLISPILVLVIVFLCIIAFYRLPCGIQGRCIPWYWYSIEPFALFPLYISRHREVPDPTLFGVCVRGTNIFSTHLERGYRELGIVWSKRSHHSPILCLSLF